MKRALLVGIVIVVGCGKKASDPSTGSGVGSGSNLRTGSSAPIGDDNPTTALVLKAFGGKKPTFPQLSKDGSVAMVEIETPVGLSGVSTYSVGFVSAGGGEPQLVTLVDAKLAYLLLSSMDSGATPTLDTDTLSKTAATITTRLEIEGFTPFEGSVEVPVADTVTAGPLKLQATEATEAALTITVTDPKGSPIATEQIKPMPMGKVGDIDCTSLPIPHTAWFDNARKRVMLQVGWNAGPDQCDGPDDQYRLWAAP